MSLTVYTTEDERLVSSTFCQLVHEGLTQGGLVVLVPTFEQVLRVQKALADKGLSLGVQVSTPQAWMRDTWDVWGDGRQIISSTQRLLLMTDVLAKDHTEGEQPQEVLAGTAQLLCDLAQRGYAWLPDALEKDTALTSAERRMAGLVVRYGH
ncbi:MAG: hypothetical protein Q4B54_14745, partial [Coriobacteriales bacterium]|nr:hypothetical protein [Coriobacteriales bacterium]